MAMASSLQAYPSALPAALVQGHGFTPLANGRGRDRDAGEKRLRPRYRRPPEQAAVVWVYTQDQFDAFDAWFESDLAVGSQVFDVQLHERGGLQTTLWYVARFVGDYAAQDLEGLRYQVSATLLLLEELGPVRVLPGIELGAPGWASSGRVAMPAASIALAGAGAQWRGGVLLGVGYIELSGLGVQAGGGVAMPVAALVLDGQGVQAGGQVAMPLPPIVLGGGGIEFAGGAEA